MACSQSRAARIEALERIDMLTKASFDVAMACCSVVPCSARTSCSSAGQMCGSTCEGARIVATLAAADCLGTVGTPQRHLAS